MKDEDHHEIIVALMMIGAFLVPFLILFSYPIPLISMPFFILLSFSLILGGTMGGFYLLYILAKANGKLLTLNKDRGEGALFSFSTPKIMIIMGIFFSFRFIVIIFAYIPIFQLILVWLLDFLTDKLIMFNRKQKFFELVDDILDVGTRFIIFFPYFDLLFIPILFSIWASIEIGRNFLPQFSYLKGVVPDMLYYYAFLGTPLVIFSAIASFIVIFLIYTFDIKGKNFNNVIREIVLK